MKKYILIYLGMIMAVSIGSSFSGQYYGQQGGMDNRIMATINRAAEVV